MTGSLASALPARGPQEIERQPRHIEIVSTPGQRRARPRVVYALVAVGGLFLILVVQLLLSIVLSNGSYQISSLQSTQKELARDQQTLTESLQVLQSPQNLAARASSLGMVMNSSGAGWLRLSDGAELHAPAAAPAASAVDPAAGALVTNVLITPQVQASQAATATATATATAQAPGGAGSGTGAPAAAAADRSVASAAIPAPTTH